MAYVDNLILTLYLCIRVDRWSKFDL